MNSNKINQKQKMDLDEEQVEEVSTSGSPVSSAARMSRKKRVSQEICKKNSPLLLQTDNSNPTDVIGSFFLSVQNEECTK